MEPITKKSCNIVIGYISVAFARWRHSRLQSSSSSINCNHLLKSFRFVAGDCRDWRRQRSVGYYINRWQFHEYSEGRHVGAKCLRQYSKISAVPTDGQLRSCYCRVSRCLFHQGNFTDCLYKRWSWMYRWGLLCSTCDLVMSVTVAQRNRQAFEMEKVASSSLDCFGYPVFIEPTITRVPSGFSWYNKKAGWYANVRLDDALNNIYIPGFPTSGWGIVMFIENISKLLICCPVSAIMCVPIPFLGECYKLFRKIFENVTIQYTGDGWWKLTWFISHNFHAILLNNGPLISAVTLYNYFRHTQMS